jgi:hypothetical protein
LKFLRVTAEEMDLRAMHAQDLGDQEPQLAVPQHSNCGILRDTNLVEDLARGCQWLGEYGLFIENRIGHYVQIALGQDKVLLEHARLAGDTQHFPARAVAAEAAPAPIAMSAIEVYFPDGPFPDQAGITGAHHLADKLVTRDALKSVIAALELQVSVAYARA